MATVARQMVDVVVVGGGPAGSAAAIWCARHGLTVCLLERQRFPRHRPGETLPPGVDVLFGQLGVAEAIARAGFTRHSGTWVEWTGERRFEAFGGMPDAPWLGRQAPRADLDLILLDAAAALGVQLRHPARATALLMHGGQVAGIAGGGLEIRASWVIDAGGGQHWLARQLGIPRQRLSPRLIARYGYVRGDCPAVDGPPAIAADAHGWTWTANIAPGLYHWTRLSLVSDDPLHDRPPELLAACAPVGPTRGADVTWRMVTRPAGPGYICAGDAAAVLDPSSSHGVLRAIMSGMMAGHVIAAARGTASPAAAARAYATWLVDHVTADASALARLYRTLPVPPPWVSGEPANDIVVAVGRPVAGNR
jgi:flavin-dependent dehydrogenase